MKNTHFFCLLFIVMTFLTAGCRDSSSGEKHAQRQLKTQCEKACAEFFQKEYGEGTFDNRERAGTVTFKYFYNQKLKKCFILLDENGYQRDVDKLYKKMSLIDVNEKKKYGSLTDIIGLSVDCVFLEKKCASEKEWDRLVKPYLDD